MAVITAATLLLLAAQCQHTYPPSMIQGIAEQESLVGPGLFDTSSIGTPNRDGSRDYGLMQINSRNLERLGLTKAAAMDGCISIAAAEAILREFSQYNSGSPTRSAEYAKRAYLAQHGAVAMRVDASSTAPDPPSSPCAPTWDAWALASCNRR